MNATDDPGQNSTEPPPGDFVPETDIIGRIATVSRVLLACIPILGMTLTPLFPFAQTPTLWLGVPAVLIWIAIMVLLSVAILQLIDVDIRRQTRAATADRGDRP